MSNTDDVRWRQRLENFGKALGRLETACRQEKYTELERAGLIQMFAFTFEMAWKSFKDLLFIEGFDEKTPRSVIRRSFTVGYLGEEDCEVFLDALDNRNVLRRIFEEDVAENAVELIKETYLPILRAAHALQKEKKEL